MPANDELNIKFQGKTDDQCVSVISDDIREHKDAITKLNDDIKKHQQAIITLQKRLAAVPIAKRRISLEGTISLVYKTGVSLSLFFFLAGMLRFYIKHQSLSVDYNMFYKDFYQFTEKEMQLLSLGHFRSEILLNAGLMILLITPMVQTLTTGIYMISVNKNWKYGVISLFVLVILAISLLLH